MKKPITPDSEDGSKIEGWTTWPSDNEFGSMDQNLQWVMDRGSLCGSIL